MCNFVPGECLALAEEDDTLRSRLSDWRLPGSCEIIPLIPEGLGPGEGPRRRLHRFAFVHVTGIPEGLEVLTVSKLSAALHDLIAQDRALVELNLYVPLAAQLATRRRDQFSPQALEIVAKLQRHFDQQKRLTVPAPPIGLLDSGVTLSVLRHRQLTARDYTGPRERFGQILDDDHDVRGHGTEVCRILDAILPDHVPIVSGRITINGLGITVLRVATAFAHMVAAEDPAIINLSLAPRDDEVICPRCRRAVPVEAFHSLILPFVFSIAGETTMTVMAAGNRGQVSNARHALAQTGSLTLVEATDSAGGLASYSNRIDTNHAAAARAFGGDEAKRPGGIAVFENASNTYGTSYAAPFVSAAAYAYRAARGGSVRFDSATPVGLDFGTFCNDQLEGAVEFRPAQFSGDRTGVEPAPV